MMKTPVETPVETTGETTTTATRTRVKNTCRSRALVRFWFGARPTGAARYHAKTAQVPVGVPVFDGRSLEWRWRQGCLLKRGARRGRVPPRFPVGC